MDNSIGYKVNLFIPGAGKSGTTSLHSYLNQHPEICMSTDKEPAFFAVDNNYSKGVTYHNSLFECKGKNNIAYYGESSTVYFLSKDAINRIKKDIAHPKFIFVLRNPIDRIYSHFYWISNLMGESVESFEKEILSDKDSLFDANKPLKSGAYKNYLEESAYGSIVETFVNTFGKENIHIITTELLRKDALGTLNDCFNFLKLPLITSIEQKVENVTPPARQLTTPALFKRISGLLPDVVFRKLKNSIIRVLFTKHEPVPAITQKQRNWLKEMLTPEVTKLKTITGQDYVEWIDFN